MTESAFLSEAKKQFNEWITAHYGSETELKSTRFVYVEWDEKAQARSDAGQELAKLMEEHIQSLPPSREASLAMTKLEECFMWMGKAVKVALEMGE